MIVLASGEHRLKGMYCLKMAAQIRELDSIFKWIIYRYWIIFDGLEYCTDPYCDFNNILVRCTSIAVSQFSHNVYTIQMVLSIAT